ncbi:MAG TPA: CoA transferase, partial [Rubrivivax sp.]|nr:CoA transferase [Rubrivivax sp.]
KPAWDNVIQAFAGVAHSQTNPETGEPTPYAQIFADKLTALAAAQAIGAALFARARGAGGQEIRLSMSDAVAAFLWPDTCGAAAFLEREGIVEGQSLAKGNRLVRFSDGWAQIAPTDDASFLATCRILGEPVDGDPRFASFQARNEHAQEVRALFTRLYARAQNLPVDATLALLEAADVPCAKALRVDELPGHPQFRANGLFAVTDHPRAGPICGPRTPARFGTTPDLVGRCAPALGEHSEQILAELGWQTPAAELRERGVIA